MPKYLAAFLITPVVISAQLPLPQNSQPNLNQKLGIYAKPSVVRIVGGCRGTYYYNPPDAAEKEYPFNRIVSGSGYFINPDGYIVTNAHVVNAAEGGREKCKKRLFENLVKTLTGNDNLDEVAQDRKSNIDKYSRLDEKNFEYYEGTVLLPNGDAFPFDIKKSDTSGSVSNDVAIIKIEVKNAPVLKIGDSDTAKLQDPVVVIGYPVAADVNVKDLKSALEASVLTGKVSNTNKKLEDKAPILQIDVLAMNGSSGSPVLNEKGEVIGIISFGNRDIDGGSFIPFAIPTSKIQEFIRQSGASNEEGLTDRLYREGLERFWRRDYEGAKKSFEAVKRRFPQHSELDLLISESEQKIAENWDKTNYSPWVLAIGAFITGGAIVLLVLNSLKKNRSSSTAFTVDPTPVPVKPTVLQEPQEAQTVQDVPRATAIFPLKTVISTQQPYLELKNQQGQVYRVSLNKERHQIGRDRSWSDIDLPDLGWEVLSRHHAVLKKEGENYRIYDGDGKNPTTNRIWLDNIPIDPQVGYLLKDRDELKIGQDPHNQVTLTYFNPASRNSVT